MRSIERNKDVQVRTNLEWRVGASLKNVFIMAPPMTLQVLQRHNKAKKRHLFGFEKPSLCRSLCFMDDFTSSASDSDRAKGKALEVALIPSMSIG